MKTLLSHVSISVLIILALGFSGAGGQVVPTAERMGAGPLATVERLELAPVDLAAAAIEDAAREAEGLPARFAEPEDVSLTPEEIGTWEVLPGDHLLLWRLRINVPEALSLNLGFDRFRLPEGGSLVLHPTEGDQTTWEFTHRDNSDHGQLWTPVVLAEDLIVELTLPAAARNDYDLQLSRVGKGYRSFGEAGSEKSESCNNDVVCPEGDPWWAEINSVAVYTVKGYWFCTGAMVNNTAEDGIPYFLTANHCRFFIDDAASMVVYWNYQSPTCGQHGGGSLADNQSGATWRAAYEPTDFWLVELDEPPDPSWNVTYSGWDRSSADAQEAVGIHHPSADEKAISFEYDPTTTTSQWGFESPGDGTHILVSDWDDGIIEAGSSGSPLYNENHHLIGQLFGSELSEDCDIDPFYDWYGRFSVSWNGGGTPSTRLSHWLDPQGFAPMTLDLFAPNVDDPHVAPIFGLESQGDKGGPFSPSSLEYTLVNRGDSTIDFEVTVDVAWVELTGSTSGSLSPGSSATVTVGIGASADDLLIGVYDATVSFLNLTNGDGDSSRPVRLSVGGPNVAYSWNLSTNPGWTNEGQWAFGPPQGQGGTVRGYPDPMFAHTGFNVLGYNLAGDYTNSMPEYHLTTGAFDCSDLWAVSVRFWRWLNVEPGVYDHAYVSASIDGVNWTAVWENTYEIIDDTWQHVEYDLSQVADGQSTVYLRWTMGSTDLHTVYSGWNIDDIEILGMPPTAVGDHVPSHAVLGRATPNPFNPQTTITFEISREQDLVVAVYDVLGRRVQTLVNEHRAAGRHEVSWNGRDLQGRAMPSGTYMVRLETESGFQARKVMLIR